MSLACSDLKWWIKMHVLTVSMELDIRASCVEFFLLKNVETDDGSFLQDIYKRSIRCTIAGVVQGLNATVFAYGSTGRYFEILKANCCSNWSKEMSPVDFTNFTDFGIQKYFVSSRNLLS